MYKFLKFIVYIFENNWSLISHSLKACEFYTPLYKKEKSRPGYEYLPSFIGSKYI